MVRLSVNVNKVATVRNSRGGTVPSVLDAVRVCLAAGAPGITVHPRADNRHITAQDVRDVARLMAEGAHRAEYNVEGDPRPDLIALVREVRPHQCTLVPVVPGEVTSQAGWPADTPERELRGAVDALSGDGIRVSLFIEPNAAAIAWAARMKAHRVELYTEPYARAYEAGGAARQHSFALYADASRRAHDAGLGVNAGHDLNLENLPLFASIPHLAEVSIGHALISHALFVGLKRAVADYLAVLSGPSNAGSS
jgi:pyridoxine 5-phosphate synthase